MMAHSSSWMLREKRVYLLLAGSWLRNVESCVWKVGGSGRFCILSSMVEMNLPMTNKTSACGSCPWTSKRAKAPCIFP